MDFQLDQVRNFSQLPSLPKWLRWVSPKSFKIILCHFYTILHFILCDFALLLHGTTSASLLLIFSLKAQVQSSVKAALLLFSLLIMSSLLWLCFVLFLLLPPIRSCLPKALFPVLFYIFIVSPWKFLFAFLISIIIYVFIIFKCLVRLLLSLSFNLTFSIRLLGIF